MVRALLLSIAVLWPATAQAEPLTFVAVAAGKTERHANYERFLEQVAPIWNRHGMRLILRASPLDDDFETFSDIAVIEVADRSGFQAYLADPDYRAIAPLRLEALTHLIVLEGPLTVPPPAFEPGAAVTVLFQKSCADEVPAARVTTVAPVKSQMADFFQQTGCVRFVAADDIPANNVLAGVPATIQ